MEEYVEALPESDRAEVIEQMIRLTTSTQLAHLENWPKPRPGKTFRVRSQSLGATIDSPELPQSRQPVQMVRRAHTRHCVHDLTGPEVDHPRNDS